MVEVEESGSSSDNVNPPVCLQFYSGIQVPSNNARSRVTDAIQAHHSCQGLLGLLFYEGFLFLYAYKAYNRKCKGQRPKKKH